MPPFGGQPGDGSRGVPLLLPFLGEFTFRSPQCPWLGGACWETHKLAQTVGWVNNAARGWPAPFSGRNGSLGERNEDVSALSGSRTRSPERAVQEGQRKDEPSITMVEIAGCKEEQGRAEKVGKG